MIFSDIQNTSPTAVRAIGRSCRWCDCRRDRPGPDGGHDRLHHLVRLDGDPRLCLGARRRVHGARHEMLRHRHAGAERVDLQILDRRSVRPGHSRRHRAAGVGCDGARCLNLRRGVQGSEARLGEAVGRHGHHVTRQEFSGAGRHADAGDRRRWRARLRFHLDGLGQGGFVAGAGARADVHRARLVRRDARLCAGVRQHVCDAWSSSRC